jgi:hypothetical protein
VEFMAYREKKLNLELQQEELTNKALARRLVSETQRPEVETLRGSGTVAKEDCRVLTLDRR